MAENIEDKYICCECVGDLFISKEILDRNESNNCSYCHEHQSCISMNDLAERVDEVYRDNYGPGEEYPVFDTSDDGVDWGTEGEAPVTILLNMLDVNSEIAEDLALKLSDNEKEGVIRDGEPACYDATTNYSEKELYDQEYPSIWREFCHRVKHKSRFFNEEEVIVLNDLFKEVGNLKFIGTKAPIRIFGERTDERFVYRARRATTEEDRIRICLNPNGQLGPPPKRIAKAGRMNPAGISVFYGALERDTCLQEIRLTVGDIAVSGKFEIIKPLTVFDLTVFDQIYSDLSMFDPNYVNKVGLLKFLRGFESTINKPILPDDEVLEYIPTQVFVEYLANYYIPKIDAIIYSSVQTGDKGKNIAILNHASRIEFLTDLEHGPITLPPYEEIWLENDFDNTYSFWERKFLEELTSELTSEDSTMIHLNGVIQDMGETKEFYLRLIKDSVKIHRIKAIKCDFKSYSVRSEIPITPRRPKSPLKSDQSL